MRLFFLGRRPTQLFYLRFVWKKPPDFKDYQVLRHRRVVFGVASSPFMLAATLDLHLDRVIENTDKENDREIIKQLKQSFYVDNCVTSVDSPECAKTFEETATRVLAAGGFDLRVWEWSGMVGVGAESSVLGLQWNKVEDTLSLVHTLLQEETPEVITKRTILSTAQKLFDPLDIVCPVLICPKLLLQKLWDAKLDWDTEVDAETKGSFIAWLSELKCLREVRIPRWIFGGSLSGASISLHAFGDASGIAYAAVIYARVEFPDRVEVRFVMAKSRVAPKGPTTIPRLELLGATMGARLMHSVVSSLTDVKPELHYWTDSSTALAWIQRDKQWATFIYNRVQEIRRLTEPKSWRHVPGNLNPADLPSRGCSASKLINSGWHRGPHWLRLSPEQWPSASVIADEGEVNQEMKKITKKIDARAKTLDDPSSTSLLAEAVPERGGYTVVFEALFSVY